jgi:hypothetical protein
LPQAAVGGCAAARASYIQRGLNNIRGAACARPQVAALVFADSVLKLDQPFTGEQVAEAADDLSNTLVELQFISVAESESLAARCAATRLECALQGLESGLG